jgi:hypothetical protein
MLRCLLEIGQRRVVGAEPRSMRERMLAGERYLADDPELTRDGARAQALTHRLNTMDRPTVRICARC